jgi:hypothetical protein
MNPTQVQAHLQIGQQLQTKLQYLQKTYNLPKGSKSRNTAIGIVDYIKLPFYADSKKNSVNDYNKFPGLQSVAIPCHNFFGDISLPMRLTPELNFYHSASSGFSFHKGKCAERKIINEMIRHLKKLGKEKEKLTISIYSDFEPCMYCLSALKVQMPMLYPNFEVKIYFEEQLDDMVKNPNDFHPEYKIQ